MLLHFPLYKYFSFRLTRKTTWNIYDGVRYEEPFSSYTKESLKKRIAKE